MKVEITSATECRSLNSYGEKPNIDKVIPRHGIDIDWVLPYQRWQQAESERKTFKFNYENCQKDCNCNYNRREDLFNLACMIIGSIHEAKQIEGTNEVIIL